MKKTFLIILAASTILICIYLVLSDSHFNFPNSNQKMSTKTNAKIYISDNLDFEILIPEEADSKSDNVSTTIILSSGQIKIMKNGTNYTNLHDYLQNSKNSLINNSSNLKDLDIGGHESSKGFIDEEYVYFIFVNDRVYILSTTSPELYDELDQIAQSFKYLGE